MFDGVLRFGGAVLAAAVLVASHQIAASAQGFSPQLQQVIAQAEKEKTLRLVWAEETLNGSEGAQQLIDAINHTYGTHLEVKFLPLESMARVASQLLTQRAAGQPAFADVYLGTAAQIAPMLDRDMFVKVDWRSLLPGRLNDKVVDADGMAVKVATGIPGADYNTALAPFQPKSLDDFLKPEWKGKIASTPYAAGFDALSANTVWGPQRTIAYVKKLIPQLGGLISCVDEERILSGEYLALVMDCLGEKILPLQEKGAPIDRVVQLDAAFRRFYYMSIPTNAQSPDAAKLFIAFLLSEAGQKMQWDMVRLDLDYLPGSHTTKLIDKYKAEGAKFTDITIDWWRQHPEIGPTTAEIVKLLSAAKR